MPDSKPEPIPPPKPHGSLSAALATMRGRMVYAAVALAVLGALALGFAGFGVHEQMFDLDYAVRTVATGWAPGLALVAAVLGALALVLALAVPPRRDLIPALVALVLAGGTLAGANQVKAIPAANPPIHDVATDWTDPLLFGADAMSKRGDNANPIDPAPVVQPQPQAPNLTGTPIAAVNARTCPGAVAVVMTGSTDQAYAKARAAMLRDGLVLVTENPLAGRLEAVATTHWLHLKGDVVVRVKPEGAGARVDIRSVSRTGIADLGENCRRVTKLRAAIAR